MICNREAEAYLVRNEGVVSQNLSTSVLSSGVEPGDCRTSGFYAQGYAYDIVNCILGKFTRTVIELLQQALKIVEEWSGKVDVAVDPEKIFHKIKRN